MYRATLTKDFFLADSRSEPGIYWVEDVTASSILLLMCGSIEPLPVRPKPEIYESILIIRPGGYGDLLFLTPIIAELASRGIAVTICTHPRFYGILEGQPCTVAQYPPTEESALTYDRVVWIENAVEESTDDTHICDLFAARVGIELSDKQCRYIVDDDERMWADGRFPKDGRPRVGIQAKASADCRSYPDQLIQGVGSMLLQKGCEVVLFGAPGSMKAHPMYLCLPAHGLDIRQSAAVLASCDACVAPDSAICHLAGALGIPTVALYGPFPAKARTRYAPSIFALSGQAPCAPCFHHARVEPYPALKPCVTAKQCVALGSIHPERVVQKVLQMISSG